MPPWLAVLNRLGCQCIWAELHETTTSGLYTTLAVVNRLGRQCIWAELHETRLRTFGHLGWQYSSLDRLGCQCIWAELHETMASGLYATLAVVNRLGRCRCRATRP